jgi:predicted AlkP superfamily phosphohydrolase/phosphomutase
MAILKKSKRTRDQKTVVIGLDGVPFSLLKKLKNAGNIPEMSSIFEKGYFGQMSVSIPEISSVSWSSFMTGTQSGNHGIFGFVDLVPSSYKIYFPNFSNLRKQTIFDDLGKKGRRSVVINLPSTYPAREISGVLISGFVAIDIKKAVFPSYLRPELEAMGYSIDIDTKRGREDFDFLISALDETLRSRQMIGETLWEREDWDLFVLVITGTDRINHFMWNAWSDNTHSRHTDFIHYYSKVDNLVGLFYKKFLDLPCPDEGLNHFIMLSDHGFTDIRSEIYLNHWLKENGYLSFKKEPPESWEDISSESKAFVLDPSRIYINHNERFINGSVAKKDVEQIKAEIRSGLKEITFKDGSPVLKKIFDRDEIYHGPYRKHGPNLVLLSHHGFDLKGKINSETTFGHSGLYGMHTQNDAFFFSNNGQKVKSIFDIKEVILNTYR